MKKTTKWAEGWTSVCRSEINAANQEKKIGVNDRKILDRYDPCKRSEKQQISTIFMKNQQFAHQHDLSEKL